MKHSLLSAFKKSLNVFGFDVNYKGDMPKSHNRTWRERLKQARELGFLPKFILDGGAFRGLWSKEVAGMFPGAQLILVEPNPFVQNLILQNTADIQPMPILLNIALGESIKKSSLNFWQNVENDQGASLLNHVKGPAQNAVDVQVDTIDNIVQRLSMSPDLLKLDLQGGELAALRGAERVLQNVELVIVEFGCLDAYIDRTNPRELLDIMYDHDFCLYDIASLGDRPYDGALTGGDFFFVKNKSTLKSYKGWE